MDTSFIVSLYVTDSHSQETRRRILTSPLLWLTPLHRAEWAHVLSQHIFHRKMSPAFAEQTQRIFESDQTAGLWKPAEIPEQVFEVCADLARTYGPRLGVRTLDTLHVASALQLKAEQFWTFDERQGKLAKGVGFKQR